MELRVKGVNRLVADADELDCLERISKGDMDQRCIKTGRVPRSKNRKTRAEINYKVRR